MPDHEESRCARIGARDWSPQLMTVPARTLTFLFTDIEGSTALWETRPDEMSAALRRHDTILRGCIEGANGKVFKTGGDAFYAVFDFPPDAIAAAVAIQEALAREPWPGPELHVRAAIHSGDVEERDNDYFGPTLNGVARLLSAGHGDQILMSEASYDLARELAAGLDALPMGAHRLKDLRRPMEIFQLLAPSLRRQFPALRTLTSRSNNLPAQLSSFIGREREIAEAKELLAASRLVTMTGPGGTGKTRLALQTAAELLDNFGDGLWFTDLAPLADPEGVPSAVATTLGLGDEPSRPLMARLTEFLQARQLLLVLDNCEHVIAGCAVLVDGLLSSCPSLRVLATSREALALPGETVMAIPALSVPPSPDSRELTLESVSAYEAVQLFKERAAAAAPHFALTDANAPTVARICSRLDGVPLAIELAAARVKSLSANQIEARLEDRFRLLTGGSRTALPRQQTLRATIDWSYQLLTEGERTLFRRLSVFVGGWTLEAAEAVCADEVIGSGAVFDLAAQLVDRSLVVFEEEPTPRYGYLETIREYSSEKLIDAAEGGATRDAHLAWFVALAEAAESHMRGADRGRWLQLLGRENDNLRAALQWSDETPDGARLLVRLVAALWWFWMERNKLDEGEAWINRALLIATDLQLRKSRGQVLNGSAALAYMQGHHTQAKGRGIEAVALFRDLGDTWNVAFALGQLAMFVYAMGEYDEARAIAEECTLLFRQSGDRWGLAIPLGTLARIALRGHDYERARALLEESLAIRRQVGDPWLVAQTLNALGDVARAQDDIDGAAKFYEDSLIAFEGLGNVSSRSGVLHNLGHVARRRGQYPAAARYFSQSLKLFREQHDQLGIAECIVGIAGVASGTKNAAEAAQLLGAADQLLASIDAVISPSNEGDYQSILREVHAQLGSRESMAERAVGALSSIEHAIVRALEVAARVTSGEQAAQSDR